MPKSAIAIAEMADRDAETGDRDGPKSPIAIRRIERSRSTETRIRPRDFDQEYAPVETFVLEALERAQPGRELLVMIGDEVASRSGSQPSRAQAGAAAIPLRARRIEGQVEKFANDYSSF